MTSNILKQTELIKLKIKDISSNGEKALKIKETFIKACELLDASIFEPLIDEEQYFQDMGKYRFLASMNQQFEYLRGLGLKQVKLVMGTCKMCYKGEKVYEFYIEPIIGKPAFAYIFQEEDGKITDILRCNFSSGYKNASRENRDSNITYIDYDYIIN